MKKVALIGIGKFGTTLALSLSEKGCDVLAIDQDKDRIDALKDKVTQPVAADALDKSVLEKLGVHEADVVVVSLGGHIDSSVLACLYLHELGVKKIIVKAVGEDHAKVLKAVGAHEVLIPERDEALRLANTIVSPNILESIQLSDEYGIVEVAAPEKYFFKTLRKLEIRRKFEVHVLGIHKPLEGSLNVVPPPDYEIRPDDVLIVIGENRNLEKFKAHTQEK